MVTSVKKVYTVLAGASSTYVEVRERCFLTGLLIAASGVANLLTSAEEVAVQVNSQQTPIGVNDTSNVLGSVVLGSGIAGGAFSVVGNISGMAVPLSPGDRIFIYIGTAGGGTAFTSRQAEAYLYLSK